MTKQANLSNGASGENRKPDGKSPASPSQPAEIRMNMPDRTPGSPDKSKTSPGGEPPESMERLLLKLMARLDENDRHYGQALEDLNDRLNTLSQRAHSASTASPAGSTAALDRLHEQASSFAAQVNDADAAHRAQQAAPIREIEQRLATFANHLEENQALSADSAENDDFAESRKRLEQSLAADPPGAEFEALSTRMDDLARHMDAALATKNDPATLRSIETRLEELARSFASAQQYYARIEDIEGHLLNLMNWAQTANAPVNDGNMHARLEAIECALHALNDNARQANDPAGGTLEAPNAGLGSPAPHLEPSRGSGTHHDEPPFETGPSDRPQTANVHYGAGDEAEVWIEEVPKAKAGHEPTASLKTHLPERRGGKADRRAQTPGLIEPAFDEEDDFVASARRAADAAAAQAPETGGRNSGSGGSRAGRARQFPKDAGKSASSASKRPRALFITAAAGLLLISAGILFGQLNNKPEALTTGSIPKETVQPPSSAPKAPATEGNKQSSQPAPEMKDKKLHTGRMEPGSGQPGRAGRTAPVTTPLATPATPANYRASAPARDALPALKPQQSVSTATLLALLSQERSQGLSPEVQVTIKAPAEDTPAPHARAALPALVPPPVSTPRSNLLAQPKRAPAGTAKNNPTSSNAQPMPSQLTTMPPLRIGPQSLRVAAARGNPAAQVEVASRFARGAGVAKNMKKAAEWFKRAAAQGFAPAQYRLAALHERGQGVKKDMGLARSWYRRAAELGNIRAMHNLAVLYTRAGPNKPDFTIAKNWFHEAARHGLADSQYNLGVLYETGLGVRKNIAEAYKWFTLAARQGDDEARKRREGIRPKLPSRSLSVVEKTLKRWKSATPEETANKTGQPRGGWHNAVLPKAARSTSGALVTQAQKLLNKLGYSAGIPDGKLGPQTVAAIRRFQSRNGAPQSGRVTPTLLQQLGALTS